MNEHPDARVVRAYNERFRECMLLRMPYADARDFAAQEAERMRRQLASMKRTTTNRRQ